MSEDIREDILDRLLAILSGLSGLKKVKRNDEDIPENLRPAAVLFDGGETADEEDPENRPNNAPRNVFMTPDIIVLLGDDSANVGQLVNEWRVKIVKAIQTDSTLAALAKDRGGIRYLGSENNLESGRNTEVWMSINFGFNYVLRFHRL